MSLDEGLKSIRAVQRTLLAVCAAIFLFAIQPNPIPKYKDALQELGVLSEIDLERFDFQTEEFIYHEGFASAPVANHPVSVREGYSTIRVYQTLEDIVADWKTKDDVEVQKVVRPLIWSRPRFPPLDSTSTLAELRRELEREYDVDAYYPCYQDVYEYLHGLLSVTKFQEIRLEKKKEYGVKGNFAILTLSVIQDGGGTNHVTVRAYPFHKRDRFALKHLEENRLSTSLRSSDPGEERIFPNLSKVWNEVRHLTPDQAFAAIETRIASLRQNVVPIRKNLKSILL